MKNRGKRTVPVCIALTGGKARTLRVLLTRLAFAIFFVAVAPRPGLAQEPSLEPDLSYRNVINV